MSDENPIRTFSTQVCEDPENAVVAIAEYVRSIDVSWEGNQEGFKYALLLLLSRDFGTDPKLLASLTGNSQAFVETFASRAREVGLWVGANVAYEHWEGDYGQLGFLCDVLVLQRVLERRKNKAGGYEYRSAECLCVGPS
jgi:hypothetical protein